jgi:group I intron endonuclease
MARGIYKIINITNNKFYVGSAVDLKRRKTRHFSELRKRKHNNKHLQAAWDKYGEKSFIFVVVEELEADADVLAAENVWLKEHVGKEYCYNIGVDATAPSLGMSGELSPTFGRKRTAEELAAQSWQGRKHKEESKQKIRAYLIGKPKPAEVRAKISATLKGEGNFWYGKKRPDHGAKVCREIHELTTDTYYPSIAVAREHFNFTPTTINRALKSGKAITRGPHKGLQFKYVESHKQQLKRIEKILANHEE